MCMWWCFLRRAFQNGTSFQNFVQGSLKLRYLECGESILLILFILLAISGISIKEYIDPTSLCQTYWAISQQKYIKINAQMICKIYELWLKDVFVFNV